MKEKNEIKHSLGMKDDGRSAVQRTETPRVTAHLDIYDLMLLSHMAGNLNKELCPVEAKSDQIHAPRLKRHAES